MKTKITALFLFAIALLFLGTTASAEDLGTTEPSSDCVSLDYMILDGIDIYNGTPVMTDWPIYIDETYTGLPFYVKFYDPYVATSSDPNYPMKWSINCNGSFIFNVAVVTDYGNTNYESIIFLNYTSEKSVPEYIPSGSWGFKMVHIGLGSSSGIFERNLRDDLHAVPEMADREIEMVRFIKANCECVPCGECKGKVTELTLKYNGSTEAYVEVQQKKPEEIIFSGLVQPGDAFTFIGTDKKNTMGTEIRISVDGVLDTKIHTSCSQPIGPGLISGDFEVIGGYSKDGGTLCPIAPCETCKRVVGKSTNTASIVPNDFSLSNNYPNPFNPTTTILFSLPRSSNVSLKIYNILGKHVATLVDGTFVAGVHSVEWNASEYANGIYFYSIEAGSFEQTKKLLLMK